VLHSFHGWAICLDRVVLDILSGLFAHRRSDARFHSFICCIVVGAVGYKGQPLEPLTKFRVSDNLHRSLPRQDSASPGHSGKSYANAASCRASGWPLSCFSISAVKMPAQDGVFQQVWEDMSSIAWCPRCHGFRQSTPSSPRRLLQWWRPCDWHSWISVCGMG
jgi:hypothetical protein